VQQQQQQKQQDSETNAAEKFMKGDLKIASKVDILREVSRTSSEVGEKAIVSPYHLYLIRQMRLLL
jgi:hypothetical protein